MLNKGEKGGFFSFGPRKGVFRAKKDSKTLDKGKGYCCKELELRLRRIDGQEQMEECINWKEKYAAFVNLMPVCMESIVRCSYIISCDRPLAVQVVGPKRASTGPLY